MARRGRSGLSEVLGALIAVVVAVGIASTLFMVGARVSWAVSEAGREAGEAVSQAGSPILVEPALSGGRLEVGFYSPGAPIVGILALGPGGEVLGEAWLDGAVVSGRAVVVEGYDCTPVVIAFITEGGAVKYAGEPFTCSGGGGREGGSSGLWARVSGAWIEVVDLGGAAVAELGAPTGLGVSFTVELRVDNGCTVAFYGLGSTVEVDGSSGYSESPLAALGGVEVLGFAACLGDGLWAGVRVGVGGDAAISGRASAEALASTRFNPLQYSGLKPMALVYTDGLTALEGGGVVRSVESRGAQLWVARSQASGQFQTATGVIALFYTPRPYTTEAIVSASVELAEAAPLYLREAAAPLGVSPPVAIGLLAYRDSAPRLGIDAILAPHPSMALEIPGPQGSFTRPLKPGSTITIATPGAGEPVLRVLPRPTMGTYLKPSVELVQAGGGEAALALKPARSPAGIPFKPVVLLADQPGGAKRLILLGLNTPPLSYYPAESAPPGQLDYFEARIDEVLLQVWLGPQTPRPEPQKTYLASTQAAPRAAAIHILD